MEDLDWAFPPPKYSERDHLTFKGDPRDLDLATHLVIQEAEELANAFIRLKDDDHRSRVLRKLGPRALSIADDDGESISFLKHFSMRLAKKMNAMYNVFEQCGFVMPVAPIYMHVVEPRDDGVKPYLRFKPL